MSVLTRLMDAQLTAPIADPRKKGLKRKRSEDDPVKQIKKIKRIERKFTEEERKARIQAAKLEAQRSELNETLPGKKLPIWKRKVPPEVVGASSTTVSPAPKTSVPTQTTPMQTPTVDLLTSTPKPSKLTTDVSPQTSTPISRPPTGWSIDTNYGRDISRGVLSRPKSGRDRDRDGHSNFLTNWDRAGQPAFLKFRGYSG